MRYNRFARWRVAGVGDRILDAVSKAYDGDIVMIDRSCVRVQQHGAAVKRGGEVGGDGRIGRCRGGHTTKLPALVDAEGRPVRRSLPAVKIGDASAGKQMLPLVTRGATLIADCADDTNAVLAAVAERGAWTNIPSRITRKDGFVFGAWVFEQRDLVERFLNPIRHFRGLATPDDRSPDNVLAVLKRAAIQTRIAAE